MPVTKALTKLCTFLAKAKKATYASQGEANENFLDDGAKEFTYEEGIFKYQDRYYGFNPFTGGEVVWNNGKFFWAMNYYGRIVDASVSPKEIYAFLKKALRRVEKELPYRGPVRFKEGKFEYFNKSEGSIDEFVGEEIIRYNRKGIYKLHYHGGSVK